MLEFPIFGTKDKYTDLYKKVLVSNKYRWFYHVCMING